MQAKEFKEKLKQPNDLRSSMHKKSRMGLASEDEVALLRKQIWDLEGVHKQAAHKAEQDKIELEDSLLWERTQSQKL